MSGLSYDADIAQYLIIDDDDDVVDNQIHD